jgi:hypothetical protein
MKAFYGLKRLMLALAAVSVFGFADGLKAPQITLSVVDEPLTAVLGSIAEQAGVSIVMTNEVAGREPVSLRVRNAALETALDQALRSYNYTLSFFADQNVISTVVIAIQEKKEGSVILTGFSVVPATNSHPFRISSGAMSSNLDAYAETYHRAVMAKQKPMVYPKELTQKEIEEQGKKLVVSVSTLKK